MTDSFARRLHDRPWSVQEASPEARVEYFAPFALLVAVVWSMCKNLSVARRLERRYAKSTVTLTLSGS